MKKINTDIKSSKMVLGPHRINNDGMSQYEFYSPKKDEYGNYIVSSFETIKLFFPQAIGIEYLKALPKNYLNDIFNRIKNKKESCKIFDNEDVFTLYSNKIESLNDYIRNILEKYTCIVYNTSSYVDICSIDKESYKIFSNLPADDSETAIISYFEFPTMEEYYEKNKLFLKFLEDVDYIMNALADIGALSRRIEFDNQNSYLMFIYDIFKHMHGNPKAIFTRGIVNYTAFKFCIGGYPFNTKLKQIYSVSNLPEIKNKNSLYKYYLKNLDALIAFLKDLSFDKHVYKREACDQEFDITRHQFKSLKNAYGIMIALVSLYAEYTLNKQYSNTSFMSYVPPKTEELRIEDMPIDYRVTTIV